MADALGYKALLLAWDANDVIPSAQDQGLSTSSQVASESQLCVQGSLLTSAHLLRVGPKPGRMCFLAHHHLSIAPGQAVACVLLGSAVHDSSLKRRQSGNLGCILNLPYGMSGSARLERELSLYESSGTALAEVPGQPKLDLALLGY